MYPPKEYRTEPIGSELMKYQNYLSGEETKRLEILLNTMDHEELPAMAPTTMSASPPAATTTTRTL